MSRVRVGGGVVGLMALAATVAGCSRGASSPEEAARRAIEAMNARDEKALRAAFPDAKTFTDAIDCASGMPRELARATEKVDRAVAGMLEKANKSNEKLTFLRIEDLSSKRLLAKGEAKDGCTAKADLFAGRAKLIFQVSTAEGSREDSGRIELFGVGERWYFIDD